MVKVNSAILIGTASCAFLAIVALNTLRYTRAKQHMRYAWIGFVLNTVGYILAFGFPLGLLLDTPANNGYGWLINNLPLLMGFALLLIGLSYVFLPVVQRRGNRSAARGET